MQNHFTVGLGLFIQNCQFPYLNVGWGFFPSYSSLNEGDSCFFNVSLFKKKKKKGCEGKIIFRIPQELTQMFGPEADFKGQAALSFGYESPSGDSLNYR